jgi:hypothetical protein
MRNKDAMARTPTTDNDENSGTLLEGSARSRARTDRLSAAYAEMTADQDREAEAEQWLGALCVGTPLHRACWA